MTTSPYLLAIAGHDPTGGAGLTADLATWRALGWRGASIVTSMTAQSSYGAQAVQAALWLNDRWSLDGRDPNGCVGVLWSCAGLHDRPWGERPVLGTVRSMTAAGCARKFDVAAYVRRWESD